MMYTSYQEQMEYLDWVHMHDYGGKPREIHIREMATEVIKQPETYSPDGWNIIVRYGVKRNTVHHFVSEHDALPPQHLSRYKQINVRLAPALEGSPYVAQILAENQLRAEWP